MASPIAAIASRFPTGVAAPFAIATGGPVVLAVTGQFPPVVGDPLEIRIRYEDIPIYYEVDGSGEVTAYNDDLRIMAVGPDTPTATANFRDALTFQVAEDLAHGRPLPMQLRSSVDVQTLAAV